MGRLFGQYLAQLAQSDQHASLLLGTLETLFSTGDLQKLAAVALPFAHAMLSCEYVTGQFGAFSVQLSGAEVQHILTLEAVVSK